MGQRSLKVIEISAIRNLGCGFLFAFYSNLAVSVAVCEIFSVRKWRDLENQDRGRSRSLKMGRSIDHMRLSIESRIWSIERSAIVNIALSCTIFELFDVK